MTVRVVGVVQARVGSSRLPGKVLLPLAGAPALERMLERLRDSRSVDAMMVATSTSQADDAVAALAARIGVGHVRGSETDVLARFVDAADAAGDPEFVVRLTGDCPLVDPDIVDRLVSETLAHGAWYGSNVDPPSWPDGLDVEVVRTDILRRAHAEAHSPVDREHVTTWIRREIPSERRFNLAAPVDCFESRWTLDEPEDYVLIAAVYAGLYDAERRFTSDDVADYLAARPEIARINARFRRNEGLGHSLRAEAERSHPDDSR